MPNHRNKQMDKEVCGSGPNFMPHGRTLGGKLLNSIGHANSKMGNNKVCICDMFGIRNVSKCKVGDICTFPDLSFRYFAAVICKHVFILLYPKK